MIGGPLPRFFLEGYKLKFPDLKFSYICQQHRNMRPSDGQPAGALPDADLEGDEVIGGPLPRICFQGYCGRVPESAGSAKQLCKPLTR